MSELRIALRGLLRNPGFAAVAVLTLGLGLGANAVIFTIVNGVLLHPLGFRDPSRLMAIQESVPKLAKIAPVLPVNALHFTEWRKSNSSFEQMGLVSGWVFNLMSDGDPLRVAGGRISSSVFPMLGVNMQVGRAFDESEDAAGHDQVVVISDGLWASRWHRDPGVIGRRIILDDAPYEVVGVLPASPRIPIGSQLVSLPSVSTDAQIWKPFGLRDEEKPVFGDYNYGCIARLKPGVSLERATSDLDAIQNGIVQRYGDNQKLRATVTPLREQMTGSSRDSLLLLLTAVGAVLLIVCVNIASLMLIRVNARQREIAIRAAIGASRLRLLRQMSTECLVIATAGGALAIAVAYALLGVVVRNAPAGIPRIDEVHLDAGALGFTMLLTLATALLFGLLPALRFSGANPQDALRGSGRSSTENRGGRRARNLLVAAEVALSAVTLVAAGLLLNSFVRLIHVDKGFDTSRVITASVNPVPSRYPPAKRQEFVRRLLENVEALPGVTAAGVSNMLPLAGEGSNNGIILEGQTDKDDHLIVDFRPSSTHYFQAMSIPLLAGRFFDDHDRTGRYVGLVATRTAQRLWSGENPIGKRFHLGSVENPIIEVVGVVGDVRGVSLQKDPNLTVYIPYWQRERTGTILAVRTAGDPAAMTAAIRQEIAKIDPQMAIPNFVKLDEIVDRAVASRRFQMNLVLLFGAAALLLAALGVYGVVSYSVSQRTKEMGIRMVLGAQLGDVQWLVLRQGLLPVLGGLAAGLLSAVSMGRLLSGFLYGVRASDPATFGSVAAIIVLATAAGCWLPARRATRVDPAVALRDE